MGRNYKDYNIVVRTACSSIKFSEMFIYLYYLLTLKICRYELITYKLELKIVPASRLLGKLNKDISITYLYYI